MAAGPDFSFFRSVPIRNLKTGAPAVLRRNGFQDVGLVGEGPDQARKFTRVLS